MKKILITGITGFAGSFLAEHLLAHNDEGKSPDALYGTYLSEKSLENIKNIKDQLYLSQIDLTQNEAVDALIAKIQPDEVYHLAALPAPSDSFKNPQLFIHNNIDVELSILEALRKNDLKPRILVVSSGDIYGAVTADDLPVDESTPMRPTSPYAVSKIAQDYLAYQYSVSYQMPIIRVRPFNHIGPRLSEKMAAAAFAKKIAEIEKEKREPVLTVGNLNSRRDLTDVRDIVRAYTLAMAKGQSGEVYNIGSDKSHLIKDIVTHLIELSTVHDIELKVDQELLRPNDVPEIVGNSSKFRQLTGWAPKIPLEQSLKDTLEYWREIV